MLKLKLNTLATWCEELTHLKRPWCWERLKAGGEGGGSGRDGWMGSPTQWTWVWVSSGRWWRTGKPGMLLSMYLQRVGHAWPTDQYLQSHGHILRNEIAESYGNSSLNILRNSQTVFHGGYNTLHSHQQCMKVQFLHILSHTSNSLFGYSHPSENEVLSHCGSNLIFSDGIEHIFICLWPFVYHLWRNVCLDPLSIFKLVYLSF